MANSAQVDHVILRDLLLIKATHNNIMGYPGIKSQDWVLERVTAHCPTTAGYCLYLEGDGHVVKESIFLGADGPNGTVIGPVALYNAAAMEENCQYPFDIAWAFDRRYRTAEFYVGRVTRLTSSLTLNAGLHCRQ